MNSRLNRIGDWESLARRAEYRASALADIVGVTDRHLHRYFQANFERGPQQYINELRLRQAREELEKGVCLRCVSIFFGYAHVSGFSRAFKAAYGISPSQVSRTPRGNPVGTQKTRKSNKH